MRRLVLVLAACGMASLVLLARAPQAPAAAPASSPQEPFRAGVDVVQLSVSVLDKKRQPVRGLKASDFTVFENGKPQRIVAVTGVDSEEVDPAPSAWMRHATQSVAANDLSDVVGDGRLLALVIDDRNLPSDDPDMAIDVRNAARHIIEQLGPSDSAAVIYAVDAGLTQDFTSDHSKLLAAIDSYRPHEPGWVYDNQKQTSPVVGDIQQFAPAYARMPCLQNQPAVPTIETALLRITSVRHPGRKSIVYLGAGVPMLFDPRGRCDAQLFTVMRDVFRRALQSNVVIHTIDPLGYSGMRDYLDSPMRKARGTGPGGPHAGDFQPRVQNDFMQIVADNTGGRVIIHTDEIEPGIDRIFEEDASYYLVGYESSNSARDGKFRKIEVKVGQPGLTIHTGAGYWARGEDGRPSDREDRGASTMELGQSGLGDPVGLPLRVSATPIAQGAGRNVELAVVLTPRVRSPRKASTDSLTVFHNVYDESGRTDMPVRQILEAPLPFTPTDDMRYDVFTRLSVAPGRYQIRFNVQSAIAGQSGSVFVDVEAPNLAASALTSTPILLGRAPDAAAPRRDVLADLTPIVPTNDRDFAGGDPIRAFVRIFEGGAAPPAPAAMSVRILDRSDAVVFEKIEDLTAARFGPGRFADYEIELPLSRLAQGPYLLSMTATLPNGRAARQDLLFRMRPPAN